MSDLLDELHRNPSAFDLAHQSLLDRLGLPADLILFVAALGYRRDVAERLAFGEAVEAWCRRHPQPHDPEICAGCGQPLAGEALDLPDGSRVHWERHREFACLIAAGLRRKARAVKALAAMGLALPPGWRT